MKVNCLKFGSLNWIWSQNKEGYFPSSSNLFFIFFFTHEWTLIELMTSSNYLHHWWHN